MLTAVKRLEIELEVKVINREEKNVFGFRHLTAKCFQAIYKNDRFHGKKLD